MRHLTVRNLRNNPSFPTNGIDGFDTPGKQGGAMRVRFRVKSSRAETDLSTREDQNVCNVGLNYESKIRHNTIVFAIQSTRALVNHLVAELLSISSLFCAGGGGASHL